MLLYLYLPLTALLSGSFPPYGGGTPVGPYYPPTTASNVRDLPGNGGGSYKKRSVPVSHRMPRQMLTQVKSTGAMGNNFKEPVVHKMTPVILAASRKMEDYIEVAAPMLTTAEAQPKLIAVNAVVPSMPYHNDTCRSNSSEHVTGNQRQLKIPQYGPNAGLYGPRRSLPYTGGYANSFQQYVPIVKGSHYLGPMPGQYDVEFVAGNGIQQQESGYLKPLASTYGKIAYAGTNAGLANVKTGSVSWKSPEGIQFSFGYIADEFGYRPYGSHLAVAAPEPQFSHVDSYSRPADQTNDDGMNLTPYEASAPNY